MTLALLLALHMAAPAAFAGVEPSKAPQSSSLKWRTPKSAPAQSAASEETKTDGAPAAETTAEKSESAPAKSASTGTSSWNIRAIPDAKTTTKSIATSSTKSAGKSAAATTAKTARPRQKAQRLADAEPSPHSSGNSLTILRTSNEEPMIEPFGDEMPVLRAADARANKRRAVPTGLQEGRSGFDPFGDTPPLERVPSGNLPERVPAEGLAQGPRPIPAVCPSPKEYIKKLSDISTNIAVEPGELPQECGLGDEAFVPRDWQCTLFAWKASALCHKPLYFEDVELERYGQTCSPLLQPFISGAKFWLTLPILPYKFGLEPPCECIYPLGYYRPGSCAPFIIPPVPISVRGALLEAGVWVAGVALVP